MSSEGKLTLGPTLLRLGQLNRDAGETKRATDYYTQFIDLWKNADADRQPTVTLARNELSDMTKAKGWRGAPKEALHKSGSGKWAPQSAITDGAERRGIGIPRYVWP